jgi:hypothetical protein
MALSQFTGMRKLVIRDNTKGAQATFATLTADKIGSDGITVPLETNELTESSFAGDMTVDNGTNIGTATFSALPKTIEDLKTIWPDGWDETTGSWAPPIGGCTIKDATIAWEKVCDTKANLILKHCSIGLGFELTMTRDDAFTMTVNVYPSLSSGTEYGLTGDNATKMFPYMLYDGTYDPTTDTITFDKTAAGGGA